MNNDEAVRIAEDAAGIVDAGWCQGRLWDNLGNHCAVGALHKAESLQRSDTSQINYRMVYHKLDKYTEALGYLSVPDFNDHPSTTQSQVSDMFRMVANELAGEEPSAN